MTKKPEEMIGTPPDKRMRFTCKRYQYNKLNGNEIQFLTQLVKKEREINTRYPARLLDGVINYLNNTTLHPFEGRVASYTKNSFAVTELENALSFQDDSLKIDYLVYRYKFAEYPVKKIVSEFPIIVAIEPTSLCNLRCIMCFQSDTDYFRRGNDLMGYLDMGLYRELIDEMAENQPCGLVLASRGEPLLHGQFTEMVAYAVAKGIIDVKINTNATALTEKKVRELLKAAPSTIVFSVDAGDKKEFETIRVGANFDKVLANIKRFNEIREKEFPNSPTKTIISMTIFRPTQDAEQAEKFWAPMVDEFAIHSANYFVDIYDHPEVPSNTPPCSYLWDRISIWWDGSANPCDIDYKSHLSLGKVGSGQTIKSVWLGKKMQEMRANHMKGLRNLHYPCGQCHGPTG